MTLTLPDSFVDTKSAEWVALHFAIGLYVSREVSLGKAAELAGISRDEFQRELCDRKIPSNYSMEDFEEDMRSIREMIKR